MFRRVEQSAIAERCDKLKPTISSSSGAMQVLLMNSIRLSN